jgi:hypothetical protein
MSRMSIPLRFEWTEALILAVEACTKTSLIDQCWKR